MNTNMVLIAQNELFNAIMDLIEKYKMSEAEMLIVLQFAQSKIAQMALTRNAYSESLEGVEQNETCS